MHKNATKCNETLNKWCKNKHGASKIMDTLETYHPPPRQFDHAIPLLPGAKPVNLRPYWFNSAQKDEVECQIKQMLEQGII
jgi:hypothetical protein